jgi:hypothetical protein
MALTPFQWFAAGCLLRRRQFRRTIVPVWCADAPTDPQTASNSKDREVRAAYFKGFMDRDQGQRSLDVGKFHTFSESHSSSCDVELARGPFRGYGSVLRRVRVGTKAQTATKGGCVQEENRSAVRWTGLG